MIALSLIAVSIGCGGGDDNSTDTTRKTGIGGIVVNGSPYSESNIYQQASPLPPGRANARVLVYVGPGIDIRQIAETRSGADGRFFIPLPPGSYSIFSEQPTTISEADFCETGDIVTVTETENVEIALGYANCRALIATGKYNYLTSDDGRAAKK